MISSGWALGPIHASRVYEVFSGTGTQRYRLFARRGQNFFSGDITVRRFDMNVVPSLRVSMIRAGSLRRSVAVTALLVGVAATPSRAIELEAPRIHSGARVMAQGSTVIELIVGDVPSHRVSRAPYEAWLGFPWPGSGGTVGVPYHFEPTTQVAAVVPNPATGACEIRMVVPKAQRLSVSIFDLQGRQVRKLHDGWLPAGLHPLRWDGRGHSSARLAAGVYLAVIRGEGPTRVHRIALIR